MSGGQSSWQAGKEGFQEKSGIFSVSYNDQEYCHSFWDASLLQDAPEIF